MGQSALSRARATIEATDDRKEAGAMQAGTPEIRNHANLIWGVAELLRGDYKQADYGKVILPLVLMRRIDQALQASKDAVLARAEQLEAIGAGDSGMELALLSASKLPYYNRSK